MQMLRLRQQLKPSCPDGLFRRVERLPMTGEDTELEERVELLRQLRLTAVKLVDRHPLRTG